MKFRKITPYKIGLTALIGLPLLLTACKEKQDPEPTRDVEIEFNHNNTDEKLLDLKTLQILANDKSVRYVYLTATGDWYVLENKNISILRKNGLQPCIELSPKIKGKGNFNFKLGEASKVPGDSLWIVNNGWTINKQYQK